MKKRIIALLLCGSMVFAPVSAYASDSMTLEELQEAYKELEKAYNKEIGKTDKKDGKKASKDTMTEHFEADLSVGNYIAGKDIPVGTYNFTATSGNGNVSSTNLYSGGINSIMGSPADEYTQETYNNVSLDDDVVLSLGGDVVLHIVSDNASLSTMQARVIPDDAQTIDLTSGNYTSGTDFPAGTYNVVATSGTGNVSSDNLFDGGINEVMGTDGSAYTVESFNNVVLDEGVILTVVNVSIQLVPVGE